METSMQQQGTTNSSYKNDRRTISVVLPIYNVEKYIRPCIQSLVNQTNQDFEVILVDDGSTDNSIDIAEEILKENDISFQIIKQRNSGLAAARNAGIRLANGIWVVCIDSDDVICKDFLHIVSQVHEPVLFLNFKVVTKDNLLEEPSNNFQTRIIDQYEMLQSFLTRKYKLICPATFIRKDFLVEHNLWYNKNILFSEDQEFLWRVLFTTESMAYNETPSYNYFLRSNSIMTSSNIEKMWTGFLGIQNFCAEKAKEGKHPEIVKYILPRWVLGTLRTTTKLLNYKDFSKFADKMNAKTYIRMLKGFPENKARLLALLMIINRHLFYFIMRRFS